jgi:hypothetical protein
MNGDEFDGARACQLAFTSLLRALYHTLKTKTHFIAVYKSEDTAILLSNLHI